MFVDTDYFFGNSYPMMNVLFVVGFFIAGFEFGAAVLPHFPVVVLWCL